MKKNILSELKTYIEKSKKPGRERTYHVCGYEIYNWKGDIYICDCEWDRPAEAYSEENLSKILNSLKSGNYTVTN